MHLYLTNIFWETALKGTKKITLNGRISELAILRVGELLQVVKHYLFLAVLGCEFIALKYL